ncbi:MAG: hypothetical protein FJ189_09575 [Gammaproteobacteria bacterium]|nr:hypothetical protein [Gammaproteobacteria bacterium]
MRPIDPASLRELAADLTMELARLAELAPAIAHVRAGRDSEHAPLFRESLALKLHNFYGGVERILQLVAVELNGGLPSGADWHKRLLDRMAQAREGRPAVVSAATAGRLREFLGFRHIVRHLYGFELDPERLDALAAQYPDTWAAVHSEVEQFIAWLRDLAERIAAPQ